MPNKISAKTVFLGMTAASAIISANAATSTPHALGTKGHDAIKMNLGPRSEGKAQDMLARNAATAISKGLDHFWSDYEGRRIDVGELLTVFSDRSVSAVNQLYKTGKPQVVGVGDSATGDEFGIIIDAQKITVFARELDKTTGKFTTVYAASRDTSKGPESAMTEHKNPECLNIGVSSSERLPREPSTLDSASPCRSNSLNI